MAPTIVTGYRKRPWELTVLAAIFALVPVVSWLAWCLPYWVHGRLVSPVDVLVQYFGTGSNGLLGWGHSLVLAGLWVLFLVVARGIFRVTRWGFYLCIAAAAANALFAMVVYGVVQNAGGAVTERIGFNPFQTGVLVNLVFFIPVLVILRGKILAPFFNPRLKWWEQHPRVKALLGIEATLGDKKETFKSFDISASGMFLGAGEASALAVGAQFPAVVHLEDLGTQVEVVCRVVWVSDGSARSPAGCGVTFEYPRKKDRRVLKRYIRDKIRGGHLLERT